MNNQCKSYTYLMDLLGDTSDDDVIGFSLQFCKAGGVPLMVSGCVRQATKAVDI